MVMLSAQRLGQLESALRGKRIMILGDVMVDRYYWGTVQRVSPEAPVPVVEVVSESARLGGAANVANNIQGLGGEPILVGLVGNDHGGEILTGLMKSQGLATEGIIAEEGRRTTEKTRVIAHDQHVVRIDIESRGDCAPEAEERVIETVRAGIASVDALILEDYNKGTITKGIIGGVIDLARKNGKPISVDPKFDNFLEFRNVTVFKPNRREAEEVLGGRIRTTEELLGAGRRMLRELSADNILLTRGAEGMSLFESDGSVTHLETAATHVKDVSGAGDTVIGTLTMALAAGATVREAAVLANQAAGIVVGSVGIVPIDIRTLMKEMARKVNSSPARDHGEDR